MLVAVVNFRRSGPVAIEARISAFRIDDVDDFALMGEYVANQRVSRSNELVELLLGGNYGFRPFTNE